MLLLLLKIKFTPQGIRTCNVSEIWFTWSSFAIEHELVQQNDCIPVKASSHGIAMCTCLKFTNTDNETQDQSLTINRKAKAWCPDWHWDTPSYRWYSKSFCKILTATDSEERTTSIRTHLSAVLAFPSVLVTPAGMAAKYTKHILLFSCSIWKFAESKPHLHCSLQGLSITPRPVQ